MLPPSVLTWLVESPGFLPFLGLFAPTAFLPFFPTLCDPPTLLEGLLFLAGLSTLPFGESQLLSLTDLILLQLGDLLVLQLGDFTLLTLGYLQLGDLTLGDLQLGDFTLGDLML